MKWPDSNLAYAQGVRDGWSGSHDTIVENFNQVYELGFILGWNERKRLEPLHIAVEKGDSR
jgi:hypothetical protein